MTTEKDSWLAAADARPDGTEPRERPILFSAPMVRALLAGTKTPTRRVAKPQPTVAHNGVWSWETGRRTGHTGSSGTHWPPIPESILAHCPYGRPGDRLWVREGHALVPASAYRMSEGVQQTVNPHDAYQACIYAAAWDRSIPKWRPSIHMPRWASRITLEITDVRVERLNEISEGDAIAEGLYRSMPDDEDRAWFHDHTQERAGCPPTQAEVDQFNEGVWMVPGVPQGWGMSKAERQRDRWAPTPQFAYRQIWEHINGPGSWAVNPFVWAVTFQQAASAAAQNKDHP